MLYGGKKSTQRNDIAAAKEVVKRMRLRAEEIALRLAIERLKKKDDHE